MIEILNKLRIIILWIPMVLFTYVIILPLMFCLTGPEAIQNAHDMYHDFIGDY